MTDLPTAIGKKTCHVQFPYPWLGMQQGSQPHPGTWCFYPGTSGVRSWQDLGFACCLVRCWTLATSTVILVGLCVSLLRCWWGNPCNSRSGYLWDCSQHQLKMPLLSREAGPRCLRACFCRKELLLINPSFFPAWKAFLPLPERGLSRSAEQS